MTVSPLAIRDVVAARFRRIERGDRGTTLIEMLFSIFLFSIFVAIFLAAVVQITRSTSDSVSRSSSSSSVLVSFQDLDRSVRWADSINPPGVSGTNTYVEFHTAAVSSVTGVETCSQWRYVSADGIIQERSWNAATGVAITGWATRSTNIQRPTGASATYPFEFSPVSANSPMQKLTLTLVAGRATDNSRTRITTTYLARNSSSRSVNPICNPTGYRP